MRPMKKEKQTPSLKEMRTIFQSLKNNSLNKDQTKEARRQLNEYLKNEDEGLLMAILI